MNEPQAVARKAGRPAAGAADLPSDRQIIDRGLAAFAELGYEVRRYETWAAGLASATTSSTTATDRRRVSGSLWWTGRRPRCAA